MIWPFTTIATLRHAVSALEYELKGADEHTGALERKIKQLEHEIKHLEVVLSDTQAVLRKAQKNDVPKDIKTGKFTKKAKDV